ncbi:NAD(+) kinase [Candidatus Halobeggiatoa sp. HSG11]|nr:NAD(+) kinase [Candidatus Halobeggiatoa sp. HSG11]
MFKNIGIIAKQNSKKVSKCLQVLVDFLLKRQINILIDASNATDTELSNIVTTVELGQRCDLIIVIGGDGTLLKAARLLAEENVYLLGINLGRLGFLTDLSPTEVDKHLIQILNGAFIKEKRFLIEAKIYRNENFLSSCNALNDIIIYRCNIPHMLSFETTIDGHFVNRQRADGLIISTPTGSTAYALSAGGPIIHPSLNALVLVTICPHTLSNRPLVIDGNSNLQVAICDEQIGKAQLSNDGLSCQELISGDSILIKKHKHITLIHPQTHDHYATLRAKLAWS